MSIDPRLLGERRAGADRKLEPHRELELVRDYLAGIKLKNLKRNYDLSKPGIYGILKRHGIQPRLRRNSARDLKAEGIRIKTQKKETRKCRLQQSRAPRT